MVTRKKWNRATRGLVAGAGMLAFCAAVSCYESEDMCEHPEKWLPDHKPPPDLCPEYYFDAGPPCSNGGDAGEDQDAATDGPIEPTCAGVCWPLPKDGWGFPDLVWMGPESEAPACPAVASKLGYEGHDDLSAVTICGECRCEKPTGTCALPTQMTAAAATCATMDANTPQVPFNPPVGWDGSCSADAALPGVPGCTGPLCTRSVTIDPLALDETPCVPTTLPGAPNRPSTWNTFVRSCRGIAPGTCGDNALMCVPPAPPGFQVCVYQKGDHDCSATELAPYTEKHVFYEGIDDTRTCTPCACDAPLGSTCTANVGLFADDACGMLPVVSVLVDSSGPSCHDVVAGSALRSRSATAPVYAPGACAPTGGAASGAAVPSIPSTFCCIPGL